MAKANRQKYNFLTALVSQLDQATDDEDELAQQFSEVTGISRLADTIAKVMHQYDTLNQWVAQLELAMAELDDEWRESAGSESESYDDGDDDSDIPLGDEPPMGGLREADRRVAPVLGGTRPERRGPQGRVPGSRATPGRERVVTGRRVRSVRGAPEE